MVVTSAATFLEMLVITLSKISEHLNLMGSYGWVAYFAPLFAELTYRELQLAVPMPFTTSKLLLTQLILLGRREGILVSIVKFYLMLDLFNTQQPTLLALALLGAWQLSFHPLLHTTTALAQAKRTVANALFLALLAFNLDRDAAQVHQIVDFYIITHLLLSAAEVLSRVMAPATPPSSPHT